MYLRIQGKTQRSCHIFIVCKISLLLLLQIEINAHGNNLHEYNTSLHVTSFGCNSCRQDFLVKYILDI